MCLPSTSGAPSFEVCRPDIDPGSGIYSRRRKLDASG